MDIQWMLYVVYNVLVYHDTRLGLDYHSSLLMRITLNNLFFYFYFNFNLFLLFDKNPITYSDHVGRTLYSNYSCNRIAHHLTLSLNWRSCAWPTFKCKSIESGRVIEESGSNRSFYCSSSSPSSSCTQLTKQPAWCRKTVNYNCMHLRHQWFITVIIIIIIECCMKLSLQSFYRKAWVQWISSRRKLKLLKSSNYYLMRIVSIDFQCTELILSP